MEWLVKNGRTVFSKLTWKIPLSVSGKQASKHVASSFPFSDFQILSSLLICCFSGISCTFHFGQMVNGFVTSTFDFYCSLALQFSCITVRLSEGRVFLHQLAISFSKKVLSLKKYVPALLSRTQIYKITLCPRDTFSQLTEAQS